MGSLLDARVWVPSLAWAIPALYAIVAVATPRRAWFATVAAAAMAAGLAIGASAIDAAASGIQVGIRVDVVTCVMMLLVCALGAVVVRFSLTYLHRDPGMPRYLRWLLLTLSAVTVLIGTNNLLVLIVGWTATSLALHQLLTFFRTRAPALVAAHKKFLVSRLAEVCLIGCAILVVRNVGTLDLDRIGVWVGTHPETSSSMQVAAVLLVVAVALKSAQLPFHGWLTQVMEAPTPVSALLHAGVVNIGGFVLIRLAPWMDHAPGARLLLVVLGLVSATVAALVMTTRVSVKVSLAWSTCAQMGFMLVQCGLGLWHLALLHLVAHSLYKAYAFLSAGSTVEAWRLRSLARPSLPSSFRGFASATVAAIGCGVLGLGLLQRLDSAAPSTLAAATLGLLVGSSMLPLTLRANRLASVARVGGAVLLYVGSHAIASRMMPTSHPPSTVGWALVAVAFGGLFAVKTALQLRPEGRFARALYPWLFAGFYLDERFTRVAFRAWPPRLHPPAEAPRTFRAATAQEMSS